MTTAKKYILGLDIGTNSIGWAVLNTKAGKPAEIVAVGSRVFESVMKKEDIERGSGETANAARRNARQLRRQTERRRRRRQKVFHLLQNAGLLPNGEAADVLPFLDATLRQKHFKGNKTVPAIEHTLPYYLRALALDKKLDKHELGRAIYHLAQRRGFLSNRKQAEKDDDGKVKGSIKALRGLISQSGSRTLGEYFSRLDPEDERIRQRYTHRSMFLDEFDEIYDAQSKHHPDILTDEFRAKLHKAIFRQRPLKSVRHLIGKCSLEPGERRGSWSTHEAQRFRSLQQINNTEIIMAGTGEILALTDQQRNELLAELEKGDLSFAKAKKLIGLKRTDKFNWEHGGEKKFLGNRINGRFIEIFGDDWLSFAKDKQTAIINDVKGIVDDAVLRKRGLKKWELGREKAEVFSGTALEDGYCSLSRKAIKKLLPPMEKGTSYGAARKEVYPESFKADTAIDWLPAAESALDDLRNPVVGRSLSELRKVVNSIIRQYGKPAKIHIELARDLRNSAKRRQQMTKTNRVRERERENAANLIKEAGVQKPSRDDIEKYLLAEECNWKCPYTGKSISMGSLFRDPQFDVEHIIPFSRSLDNSFINKTICCSHENRNIKKNMTPFEAYQASGDKWDKIQQRVRNFKISGGRNEKLRRFMLEKVEDMDDFSSRQLNDTRYASRLAMEYLGLLYGGTSDADGNRRVYAGNGRMTSFLRGLWSLNRIFGGTGQKQRTDHRHHAIDAVVTAMLSPRVIGQLSRAAEHAKTSPETLWRHLFKRMPQPWEGFEADMREAIKDIVTSHRPRHRVRGALHEETNYSRAIVDGGGKKNVHIRKALNALSEKDIQNIVDPVVKEIVETKLVELGIKDSKKAFADPVNHPTFPGRGRKIHKVRVVTKVNPVEIGKGKSRRHVKLGNNHHIEIFEVLNKAGKVKKWDAEVVSLFAARQRISNREPVVSRDHGENTRFKFSLCGGDVLELDHSDGSRRLYVIRTISRNVSGVIVLCFVRINDARLKKEILEDDKLNKHKGENMGFRSAAPNGLHKLNCRKITITPVGELRWAND